MRTVDMEKLGKVAVIGAGTMGSSIALNFACRGLKVNLYDISMEALERGYSSINSYLQVLSENELIPEEDISGIIGSICAFTKLEEVSEGAEFVLECAPEKLELKQDLFREIELYLDREVIFASNTSSLSPTRIAEKMKFPGRFTAANFWNPAHLLPLVEIMPGEKTSPHTLQQVKILMERIGKKPVLLTRETPGFIGNRLQFALLREALAIVESGIASKEDVDRAVKYGIGRRLGDTGPLETVDLGGVHVFTSICEELFPLLDNGRAAPALLTELRDKGHLGYTTGKGLYEWSSGELERIQKYRQDTIIGWMKKDMERKE
ncbi:MAG TPA: 3-hydroxyacyl-CoA dehydrogenase family protein [Synergistales bacterium]|nr:3-hydroxyacyl-CoA dehydrogenase family protein [Synergistales bacterium]